MMYLDDYLYHVYNRGAHKLDIFRSEFQYNLYLNLVEKYKVKYKVDVFAYCLMPNHFHLLLKQNNSGSISRFLQTLLNSYVQAFN
jgi:putative transposase